jgi:holo-[acyl-carrier protein] synthase
VIHGIGADIISVARIESAIKRHGERFAARILSDAELLSYRAMPDNTAATRWLAKRWAAKEAMFKAAGLGMRAPFTFAGVGVSNDALGKPVFTFDAAIDEWLQQQGIVSAHVSLSDERECALAFVILET